MNIRRILPVIAAVISIFFVSCSSYTTPVSKGVNHQVVISGFEFVPAVLNVSVGDTVTWVNKDIVPHTIVNNSQPKVMSPELATGQTFVYKVSSSLSYICGLHPSMKGKIIITSN